MPLSIDVAKVAPEVSEVTRPGVRPEALTSGLHLRTADCVFFVIYGLAVLCILDAFARGEASILPTLYRSLTGGQVVPADPAPVLEPVAAEGAPVLDPVIAAVVAAAAPIVDPVAKEVLILMINNTTDARQLPAYLHDSG